MPVLYEKRGSVGVITLSRPEARNAWGADFAQGMAGCLAEMEADDEVLCAVLTGDEAGRAFSAGADLKDEETHTLSSVARFVKGLPNQRPHLFDQLTHYPKPLLAAVNGYAVGIGAILTFCCDLILASERAEWRLPQASLGILPAYGGTLRLARFVGKGDALKLALGFHLKADEAYRIGLAQWLVPHEELMPKAMEVAQQIASLPPLAVRLTKESLVRGLEGGLSEASFTDLYRFALLEMTEDKEEGHAAWRERRQPQFKGR